MMALAEADPPGVLPSRGRVGGGELLSRSWEEGSLKEGAEIKRGDGGEEDSLAHSTALPQASLLLRRYRGGKTAMRNVNYMKTHASRPPGAAQGHQQQGFIN